MIVSVDALKAALGIDLDDTTEDTRLESLILSATVWIEGEVHVRFDEPITRTEFRNGTGMRTLYLRGHIDPAAVESESAEDTPMVIVSERLIGDNGAWNDLVEGEDYERRNDALLFFGVLGPVWPRCNEYRIVYPDGYVSAPEDIQAVVLEMATRQYLTDVSNASGTAGVTSEKLGDYAYTVDLGAVSNSSGGTLSDQSVRTLNHYRKRFV